MHTPDKVGPIVVMEEEAGNNTELLYTRDAVYSRDPT